MRLLAENHVMKRITLVLLCVAIPFLLAACAGTGQPGGSRDADECA